MWTPQPLVVCPSPPSPDERDPGGTGGVGGVGTTSVRGVGIRSPRRQVPGPSPRAGRCEHRPVEPLQSGRRCR
eukprot:15453425-Alexandrium_andersonii.AAC.1